MESSSPGKSLGYQKKVKQETPEPAHAAPHPVDYSSPLAKKWPQMLEALETGNADVVRSIIDEGLNINNLRDGVTPLMIAASKGHAEIVTMLLEAGANINARSENGRTALHLAAEQGSAPIVDLLVHSGIEIDAKDKSGRTALDIAEEKNSRDIVRVIRKHRIQQKTDEFEWERFLLSADGLPYRNQRTLESLEPYLSFLWVPAVGLGGVGLAVGWFLSAPVIGAGTGILLGGSAGGFLFYRIMSLRNYLSEIGPLPELNIELLRQKRKAGEPIIVSDRQNPERHAGKTSLDEKRPLEAKVAPSFAAEEKVASVPKARPRIPVKLFVPAIGFLLLMVLAGVAWTQRNAIERWYHSSSVQRKGLHMTGDGFLDAVEKNDEDAVALFLKAGISINARNAHGRTGLMIAAEKGNAGIAKKLLAVLPDQLR
jgi:hypothetical protein